MDIKTAVTLFDALSQETRLSVFRLLVEAGPSGLAAGKLSEQLKIPHNTLSFHLSHLTRTGMVKVRKEGRSMIYSTHFDTMRNLIGFLVQDCCRSDLVSLREDKDSGCQVIELAGCCGLPDNT
ncbi:Arsenical resistance operon repressor [Methylophaga frappieri]|uniref:Arsenical resistance operon repressor n=1 Tax=Methylophaga frappieri (strain ATCC BAA-2434 / DSM 25690 / JAM7) TaxID=754477 RepID=I1YFY6_METFJ|nr:metalloregulator ArsR/SmtB family transcription factor [Methylophaga frappieri]AFJ01829.1 Arsenical resistance operon repressor [Methylophaga frappieri]